MKLPRAYILYSKMSVARGFFSPRFVGSEIPPKHKSLRIQSRAYILLHKMRFALGFLRRGIKYPPSTSHYLSYFTQRLYRLIVLYIVIHVRPTALTKPKSIDPKFGLKVALTVSRLMICIHDCATVKSRSGAIYDNNTQTTTHIAITVAAALANTIGFNIFFTPFTQSNSLLM